MRYKKQLIIISLISLSLVILTIILMHHHDKSYQIDIPKEFRGNVNINNNNFSSIMEALDNSCDSDTIELNIDICENIKMKNKNITIDGQNHTLTPCLNANDLAIIDCENCHITIKNLTIDGQNMVDELAPNMGIYLKDSSIDMENVVIVNVNHPKNKVNNYPKCYAIYSVYDENIMQDIYINNCYFSNFNTSPIYINNRSQETINVLICENSLENFLLDQNQEAIVIKGLYTGEIVDNKITY